MRVLVLLVLCALPASAQTLEAWVRSKVAAQRDVPPPPPPTAIGPGGQIWREGNGARGLKDFKPPTSFAPLVKAVRGAVVQISSPTEGAREATGSGFIINPDGLVVTNAHVLSGAQQTFVELADGREFEATVVGQDPKTDLALLRLVGAKDLPTVSLGDSDELEVGDWVVAIGNPLKLSLSVTHGIISARERQLKLGEFDEFLQTNAQLHTGSSGGPLFDMNGDVVGVTTAVSTRGQTFGFAVPINLVKDLLPNLLENGKPERGWLGLSLFEVGKGPQRAVVITEVTNGSPAEKAGLMPGDRVLSAGGKLVQRRDQLRRRIALFPPGTPVKLEVVRAGKKLEFTATLEQEPSAAARYEMSANGRIEALGLSLKALPTDSPEAQGTEPGLKVMAIKARGPAERAGLALSDVLVEVNREVVGSLKDLEAALAQAAPGEEVLVRFRRGQSLRYVTLKPD